jgi:hypothetical protein
MIGHFDARLQARTKVAEHQKRNGKTCAQAGFRARRKAILKTIATQTNAKRLRIEAELSIVAHTEQCRRSRPTATCLRGKDASELETKLKRLPRDRRRPRVAKTARHQTQIESP